MLAPPQAVAQDVRGVLVEVLRHLNRDEMEEPDVPGLEEEELHQILTRRSYPLLSREDTRRAITVLVRNGYARELTEPRYAWTRCRMVTNRFTITIEGKSFLLQSIRRVGRV
jgi:predicted AAA+ superfamily ATPase